MCVCVCNYFFMHTMHVLYEYVCTCLIRHAITSAAARASVVQSSGCFVRLYVRSQSCVHPLRGGESEP